jgi:ketol-acid reductoisomerase
MRPLFQKHMDDIISGHSKTMMEDWANDKNLLAWRAATGETVLKNASNDFS